MHFTDLRLISPLLKAVQAEGYTEPSPIQRLAIPAALDGRDVLGIAQTGTGKTAAFALPILQRLATAASPAAPSDSPSGVTTMHSASMRLGDETPFRETAATQAAARRAEPQSRNQRPAPAARRPIRALVLAPTRELASQIGERFRAYGERTGLRTAVIFGGVSQGRQVQELKAGVDVLVACPGRLLDLIGQGYVRLGAVEVLVLDEADHMLDMGFIPDIRRVIKHLPAQKQTLLFSATMPREIQSLVDDLLHDPVRIEIAPRATPAERVEHAVYFVSRTDKPNLLQHLLSPASSGLPGSGGHRVLVFTRTKRGADRVALRLVKAGLRAEAIHGDKSQGARERALFNFRRGTSPVLVATDVAARGLDVDDVSHVVNFDLPNEPETFVHRIGRTARAGASGIAVSFCDSEEGEYLADIEALIRQPLPQVLNHPHRCTHAVQSHIDFTERLALKLSRQSGGGGGAVRAGGGSRPRNNGNGGPRKQGSTQGQGRGGNAQGSRRGGPQPAGGGGRRSGNGRPNGRKAEPQLVD